MTAVKFEECAVCKTPVPWTELNADGECVICAALASLRHTLEKQGKLHPDLFELHPACPPEKE